MGDRKYNPFGRSFFGGLVLATALGCLYGCSRTSNLQQPTPAPDKVGTRVYLFQGYDRNGQIVSADLDRNDIPELAEVDLEKGTLTRILWGDYLNQGEQNPGRNVKLDDVEGAVRIRFAAQQIICEPLYVQSAVPYQPPLEPVVRPAPQNASASQNSILQQQTPAQQPAPPHPAAPVQPQAIEPFQQQTSQTPPDFTRTPKFKIKKPVGEFGYFNTEAMKARHPDSMINYGYIEQRAREQYQQNKDCD